MHAQGWLAAVVVTYGTVLLSELLGDSSIYTIGSLVVRFGTITVMSGAVVAFMVKMLLAVALGAAVTRATGTWMGPARGATLVLSGLLILGKPDRPKAQDASVYYKAAGAGGVLVSFAALFFGEWGDPGQLAAAGLAVGGGPVGGVWLGGVLALATKGAVAATLGLKLKEWCPARLARPIAGGCCLILGVLALWHSRR